MYTVLPTGPWMDVVKWPLGTKLLALDVRQIWCNATVIDTRGSGVGREVKVHYQGWNKRWDEWILERSSRLRSHDSSNDIIDDPLESAPDGRKAVRTRAEPSGDAPEISAEQVAAAQAEAAEKAELARRAAADAAEAAKAAKAARARADEAARAAAAIDFDDWTSEAEVSRQASNIAVGKGNNTLENCCDNAESVKSLKRARVE